MSEMIQHVDVHAHYYDPTYVALVRQAGVPTYLADDPLGGPDGIDQRLQMLDSANIDVQLVSGGPLFPDILDAAAAAQAAAVHNDTIGALRHRTGGRLRGLGVLPLPHVDESLMEIEAVGNNLLGWTVGATVAGVPVSSPEFHAVFDALDERGALLLIHPVGNATGFYGSQLDLSWLLGAVVEDTAVAVDLAVSGWLSRFSNIRVVIPHLGGVLPFIAKRIDDQYLRRNPAGTVAPSALIQSLWVDSVNSDPNSLAQAIHLFGQDRILLGTDFPFLPNSMFTDAVTYMDDLRVDPGAADAIRRINPAAMGVLGTRIDSAHPGGES